jgi:hypothetical protein
MFSTTFAADPNFPILSQMTPIHVPQLYVCRTDFLLFSQLRQVLPLSLFPSGLLTKSRLHIPSPTPQVCHMHPNTALSHLITLTIFGATETPRPSPLCNVLQYRAPPTLFTPNILPNTSLCSYGSMTDQVAHPCKATAGITVLYTSVFILLDNSWEDQIPRTVWSDTGLYVFHLFFYLFS